MGDFCTEVDLLKVRIDKEMSHVDKEIRNKLYSIMTYEGNKVVKAKNYY